MSENQNNQGAPSSDNTSALFVSARKKQLAQQEQERIAAEKEAARIAAEEEVSRLEAEVEQRKQRAQEDAYRIEQENEERRRQAEAAMSHMPQGAQYAPPSQPQAPQPISSNMPHGQVATGSTFGSATPAAPNSLLANKQLLIIIGASVGAFIILIIILAAIFSGGSKPMFTYNMDENSYIILNEDGTAEGVTPDMTEFDGNWYVEGNIVYVNSENYSDYYHIIDDNTIYLERFEGEFVFGAE